MDMSLFLDNEHESRFLELCVADNMYPGDKERQALFFIIAGNEELFENRAKIYDFKQSMLARCKTTGICTSSNSLIGLGMNLYNGRVERKSNICDVFCSLDNHNRKLAFNAIQIRFPIT